MRIDLDSLSENKNLIKSYHPGRLMINDQTFTQSIIVSPDRIESEWSVTSLSEFTLQNWQKLLEFNPSIIILGSGEKSQLLPPPLLQPLYERKIGIEIMTNRSACHTYNVLVSEGRNVVAGIILSPQGNNRH